MFSIQSNIDEVMAENIAFITQAGSSAMMRAVSLSMLGVVKKRIHTDGIASDGSPIGTYSPGYMAVRTGIFKSNKKITKGKHKGDTRPTGVFTKGKDKGGARPQYHRTGDPKVILSLTRQMENDFGVVDDGTYVGLGFQNQENYNKSQYCEATYQKPIYDLMATELQLASKITQDYVDAIHQ